MVAGGRARRFMCVSFASFLSDLMAHSGVILSGKFFGLEGQASLLAKLTQFLSERSGCYFQNVKG